MPPKSEKTGRGWKLALAVLALFALLAAACGGDDDDASATSGFAADSSTDERAATEEDFEKVSGAVAAEESADEPAEEPLSDDFDDEDAVATRDQGAGGDAGNPETSNTQSTTAGRSIIFVASMVVTVDDVPLAASMAKTQIAGLGGLVFGEDTQTGERDRTVLQFKVLPEDFTEALNRLEGLGELESQQITADDVTERVVDLQSRITTAEASVIRLREFLVGATVLEDIATLENQLLDRETNLETLRGQLRTVQDQVSLATIFLTLNETAPPEVDAVADFEVTFYEGSDDGARCPGGDELSVDEGDELTICVQVTNVGNATLAEFEIRDDGAPQIRARDFTFVDGADERPLAPGEQLTAWVTVEAPANGSSHIVLTAVAVNEDGDSLRVGTEFVLVADYSVRFVEDDSLPGFVDALTGSLDFLLLLAQLAVLVAGALLPFVWIPFVIWGVRVWWLRRHPQTEAPMPPPPSVND